MWGRPIIRMIPSDRVVSKKAVDDVEHTVVDQASCLDSLRYKHRLGKHEIKFVDPSGPERSECYFKAAIVVHQSTTLSHRDAKQTLSFIDGARALRRCRYSYS